MPGKIIIKTTKNSGEKHAYVQEVSNYRGR